MPRSDIEQARELVAKAYVDSVGPDGAEYSEDYIAGHFDEGHDIQAVLDAIRAERVRAANVARTYSMPLSGDIAAAILEEPPCPAK